MLWSLPQIAQRCCGSIPGWMDLGTTWLVQDVLAYCRGGGTKWDLKCLSTQTIVWFYDHLIQFPCSSREHYGNIIQKSVQMAFEQLLQGRRLQSLPGQSVPMPSHPHSKNVLPGLKFRWNFIPVAQDKQNQPQTPKLNHLIEEKKKIIFFKIPPAGFVRPPVWKVEQTLIFQKTFSCSLVTDVFSEMWFLKVLFLSACSNACLH